MIESSQSEDDLKMEANEEVEQEKHAGEEVKKEQHCPSIVRRWLSKAKIKESKIDHGR